MPQVIVDTATETPASLVLLSRLFQDYAMLKAKDEKQAADEYPTVSGHTHAIDHVPAVETIVTPIVVNNVALLQDPAVLFAKPSNVLPFPQPTPPNPIASIATAPASSTANGTLAAVPAPIPPAATTSPVEVPLGTELDSARVPWDSRIHSSAKGKKQDGTWKLARNIDKALVTMVLQEITPKPHVVNGVVIPVGAVVPVAPPVTVPVAPLVADVAAVAAVAAPMPVPAVPGSTASAVPVAPVVQQQSGSVPVPPVPAAGTVPAAPLNPVQQFQAFMKLVAEGQAASPPKFTHQQVVDAAAAEGVPQLQLVIMAPDKIPAIKTRLGLV